MLCLNLLHQVRDGLCCILSSLQLQLHRLVFFVCGALGLRKRKLLLEGLLFSDQFLVLFRHKVRLVHLLNLINSIKKELRLIMGSISVVRKAPHFATIDHWQVRVGLFKL